MATTIQITDGTDTVDLSTTSLNYSLSSWAPQVADEGEVTEQIVVNVLNGVAGGQNSGASYATFYANLAKLRRLLRNAQRFGLGDATVTPVLLKWAPDDAIYTLSAVITGWDDTQFFPATVNAAENMPTEQTNEITLNITRRAPWVFATASTSSTTASADNLSVHQVTFSSNPDVPSPLTLQISGFNATNAPTIAPGYVIVTTGEQSDTLGLFNGVGTSGAVVNTAEVSATTRAYLGDVERYTPASTTETLLGNLAITTVGQVWKGRISIFAAVRNNSATATYLLRAVGSYRGRSTTTRAVEVGPHSGTAKPVIVYLGQVSSVNGLDTLSTYAAASATGAGTLDLDYMVLVRHAPGTYIIPHGQLTCSSYVSGNAYLEIDPRFLTAPVPVMALRQTSAPTTNYVEPEYYRGDLDLRTWGSTKVNVLWLAPYTLGANAFWRHVNTGAANASTQIQVTASRLDAFDVPG